MNQIDMYSEVLDSLEDAIQALTRADMHVGLTDAQGRAIIELKALYDELADDSLELENSLPDDYFLALMD